MEFLPAVDSALKKWCTFTGRASRSEYWWFVLFYWAVYMVVKVAFRSLQKSMKVLEISHTHTGLLLLGALACLIVSFVMFWLAFAVISLFVRRMHDTNHSGWWYWIILTIIGIFFPLLVWKCTKGTDGPNRFGPDPLKDDMIR